MSVYEHDEAELAAMTDDALDSAVHLIRDVLRETTQATIVTPALAAKATAGLEALANYDLLRRMHKTAVAG